MVRPEGSTTSIPAVLGYDRAETPEGPVEYLVISRMPGRATRHVPVTGAARRGLLQTLGRLLRRLHAHHLADGGLFPIDGDAGAVRHRLELALADAVEEITARPGCWPLATAPETVALRALQALPSRLAAPVVLHSNPGPTHAFVDADGTLTGLIDFGDAYLSHWTSCGSSC